MRAHHRAWPIFLLLALGFVPSSGHTQALAAAEPVILPLPLPKYRVVLGLRGVLGSVFEEHERRGGGGFNLLLGVPLFEERWELEGSAAYIKPRGLPPLGVFEVVVKRLFEAPKRVRPHLALGPALSIDLGGAFVIKGGGMFGGGLTWFRSGRLGFASDLAYRLLGGEEGVEHVLTVSAGVALRL